MLKDIKIDLEFAPVIDGPPKQYGDIYRQSCSGDKVTVDTWRPTWTKNYAAAHERFGNFGEKTVGKLCGINRHKPAIVIGSGPSLKNSLSALKENASQEHPIMTVSCLHNFGYFEDEGFHADYYLSLDSGGVVIDDVSESRNKDGGFYWEATKGKKLLAYVASDPRLFDLWQGDIYLFNILTPDQSLRDEFEKIERFSHYISCGGNALGAAMYAAKAIMGSSSIAYVGADFCFDYDTTFHSYKTAYDNPGATVPWVDIYKMPRKTWPSYLNFKFWFDWVACNVPGEWVNCSEGLLGAYPDGIIKQFRYASLSDYLEQFRIADTIQVGKFKINEKGEKEMMGKEPHKLSELYGDSRQPLDITLF